MVGISVRALLTSCAVGALAVQLSAHEAAAQQAPPARPSRPPAAGTAGLRRQTRAFNPASAWSGSGRRQFRDGGGDADGRRRQPRHDHRHADQNGAIRRRRNGRRERHHQRRDSAAAARLDRRHAAERSGRRLRGDAQRSGAVHQYSRHAGLRPRQHIDRRRAAGLSNLRSQRERHFLSRSAIRRPSRYRARPRVEHLWIGRNRRRRLIQHAGSRQRPQRG